MERPWIIFASLYISVVAGLQLIVSMNHWFTWENPISTVTSQRFMISIISTGTAGLFVLLSGVGEWYKKSMLSSLLDIIQVNNLISETFDHSALHASVVICE